MCNKNGNDQNSFCINILEWHINLLNSMNREVDERELLR